MSNPYVATAIAEATDLLQWAKAQFASLWAAHKTATLVVLGCGFVAGCVLT